MRHHPQASEQPPPPSVDGSWPGAGRILGVVAVVVAIAIIGLMSGFIVLLNSAYWPAIAWVEHTQEVIAATDQILVGADDLETGQRGFLMTEDASYLEPYRRAIDVIGHHLSDVRTLTADNAGQQHRLDHLDHLLREQIAALDRTITLARDGDFKGAVALVRTGEGKRLMDEIRVTIGNIVTEEKTLLQQRHDQERQLQFRSTAMLIGLFCLVAAALALGGVLVIRTVMIHTVRRRVATDVERRSQIEAAQRAIIIEAAPNGIMIVDERGTITLANALVDQIFGYPPGALVGQSVEILVPDGLRATHGAKRAKFTGGQDVRGMEQGRPFAGRKRDGSTVSIEILLSPVKTAQGRIVVASIFDVSERLRIATEQVEHERRERQAMEALNANLDHLAQHLARARDQAERANRAKTRFLAGMSHELRTPLNGIMGYAHLLRTEGDLNPVQDTRVSSMLEAGKHLLEMIACVLDLSEIEAERVTLRAVATDPQAIVAACLDLLRPAADAKGLALHLAVAPGTPRELVVDPARLRQVLLNLLGNAVKFTGQGGVTVKLSRIPDGSALRIEVADTGPGIPTEQTGRLFEEFERLGADATAKIEGAGLGLALSRQLAAMMGGRLGHSDNPGGGSVFCLELPTDIAASPPEPALSAESAASPAPPTGPLRTLVVDDIAMNRDVASAFLRAAGHEVVCVEGGEEAIAAAAAMRFDVILMDVRMPKMSGLEATRRIRALGGERGRVPIIALTAQAFTDQIEECRQAGMDSHLAKPFDPETLVAAVTGAVRAGRAGSLSALYPTPIMSE